MVTDALTTEERAEISRLRKEIERLTDRKVVSMDLNYLRQRVADLRRRKELGQRMPNAKRVDRARNFSVSLSQKRLDLLARACKEKKAGASAIMREAFDMWCKREGFGVEIDHIKRAESIDG